MNNPKELEKQIAEKNHILRTLKRNERMDSEKIAKIKTELDRLLYLYYKSLKGKKLAVGLI